MKNKEYVLINNKLICIDRYYYESDEMFYFRIKFICDNINNNINNNINDFEKIIGQSKIEQEKKFNGCDY